MLFTWLHTTESVSTTLSSFRVAVGRCITPLICFSDAFLFCSSFLYKRKKSGTATGILVSPWLELVLACSETLTFQVTPKVHREVGPYVWSLFLCPSSAPELKGWSPNFQEMGLPWGPVKLSHVLPKWVRASENTFETCANSGCSLDRKKRQWERMCKWHDRGETFSYSE